MNKPIKIIFMGTPHFSVPYFKSLINDKSFEVKAVITQSDKPTGRKQIITPSPVKMVAQENKLPVFQPEKLKDNGEIVEQLKKIEPDLIVVVAYGQIIPKEILALPKLGNVNVHPSLLPKYRGASPIQNAILNNETSTGITIMLMDEKMDHGPMLAQKEIILDGTEDNKSLHQKMSHNDSTYFLITTIKKFIDHEIQPTVQDETLATYCKLITKEEAKINWADSAKNISSKIRAFYPWPVAWTNLDNKRVKIFPPIVIIENKKQPGEIFEYENSLAVGCGDNSIVISSMQIEGKNKILSSDFIMGHKDAIENKFFSF